MHAAPPYGENYADFAHRSSGPDRSATVISLGKGDGMLTAIKLSIACDYLLLHPLLVCL